MRRVKVHATLGPASQSEEVIRGMILAGADGFRINFSHASAEEALKTMKTIRKVSKELGKPVSIRQDLAGPKIRVGTIKGGPVHLQEGQIFTLTGEQIEGNAERASITYAGLAKDISPGQRILLADGSIELTVLETKGSDVICRVISGGKLDSRKGVNFPRVKLSISFLTEKDLKDLEFGIKNGVDYVTLSFVKQAEDVLKIKQIIRDMGSDVPVITKIEKAEGVENLDGIIEASDGISIARGDLGVEWGFDELPLIQKIIANKCFRSKKFIMVGAQTVMSMLHNLTPTRAEVTDIVNSILDGIDVINLSDETAVGNHPVEVIKTIVKIIKQVEGILTKPVSHPYTKIYSDNSPFFDGFSRNLLPGLGEINYAVMPVMNWEETAAIRKNTTGMFIFACTPDESVASRLATYRGVIPILVNEGSRDEVLEQGLEKIKAYQLDTDRLLILGVQNL